MGHPLITICLYIVTRSSACADDVNELWAHSLVTNGGDIFIVGGLTASLSSFTDDPLVSLLHLPRSLTCSLAQSTTQCQGIPGCSMCITTDDQSNDFVACYNVSADSNATLDCANLGGVLLIENNSTAACPSTPLSCEDFQSCGACLSTDVSLELGCVWCYCHGRCIASSSWTASCPNCTTVSSTQRDICLLDRCTFPSCEDCKAQIGCEWLSRQIREDSVVPNLFHVFPNNPEWGCYSTVLHREFVNQFGRDFSVSRCPSPCNTATSCSSCVALSSPTAGDSEMCIWAEYSQECLSSDIVPIACSLGNCGPILSTLEQCPSPCGSRGMCESCLMDPSCVWFSNVANGIPRCVETTDLKSGAVNQMANESAVYLEECPLGITCHQFCHGNSEQCREEGSTNSVR